jgi:hypothetical protein
MTMFFLIPATDMRSNKELDVPGSGIFSREQKDTKS